MLKLVLDVNILDVEGNKYDATAVQESWFKRKRIGQEKDPTGLADLLGEVLERSAIPLKFTDRHGNEHEVLATFGGHATMVVSRRGQAYPFEELSVIEPLEVDDPKALEVIDLRDDAIYEIEKHAHAILPV